LGRYALMVVNNDKSAEGIREILKRLDAFFSTRAAARTDSKTLVDMERDLIKMECQLQTFSSYRRGQVS